MIEFSRSNACTTRLLERTTRNAVFQTEPRMVRVGFPQGQAVRFPKIMELGSRQELDEPRGLRHNGDAHEPMTDERSSMLRDRPRLRPDDQSLVVLVEGAMRHS